MPKRKLTEQQEQFCQFYVQMRHITNAAKAAGYSEKSAHVQGCNLLKRIKINARIFEIRSAQMADVEITSKRVLQEIAAIAFSSIHDVADYNHGTLSLRDFRELSRQDKAAIQTLKVIHTKEGTNLHFQLYDKQKALEMLGRYLALFNDQLNLKSDKPITVNVIRGKCDAGDGGTDD